MRVHSAVIVLGLLLLIACKGDRDTLAEKSRPCVGDSRERFDPAEQMVWISGGTFTFGNNHAYREEASEHQVSVNGFWMSKFEVTNVEFQRFVDDTGYITVAERRLSEERYPGIPEQQREPGSVVFVAERDYDGRYLDWWQFVPGANWRYPQGPGSSIEGKWNHPVVHIAFEDAQAYAEWIGHSLPTEHQWEFASKGNGENVSMLSRQPVIVDGQYQSNTWQGLFPFKNTGQDGSVGASAVGCYPSNANGLYDMIGNVWEWTESWYYPGHQVTQKNSNSGFDVHQPGVPVRVIKGGSFLCAPNACKRYRPSARHAQDISLGSSHIGFRTVINAPQPSVVTP